jgi:hypothetical protein
LLTAHTPEFGHLNQGIVLVERLYKGEWASKVTVTEGAQKWALNPRFDLRTQSFAGFACGSGEANGAHQLALALLADALQDDARAEQLHHDFCSRVVAIFPERWTISRSRIVAHATIIEARQAGHGGYRARSFRRPTGER